MPPKYGAAPASTSSYFSSFSSDDDEHEVPPPPYPKPKSIAVAASSTSSFSSSDDDEDEHEVPPPSYPKPKLIAAAAAAPLFSSDEDESSSSEEVAPTPNPKPTTAAPSSSDEDESSSGEEEVAPPPPNPKSTTAAKPASSSVKEESSSSDDEVDDAPPASKPAPSATPAKPIPAASAKTIPATPFATKSKAFQSTWTDKDEIALLQGMLLYNANNGVVVSSNSDMELFHQFIRGSLQIEVRPSQLVDRVRRFKANYQKTRDKGESPSIAKPHDAAIYELSRKIWGAKRVKPENGNAKESVVAKRHKGHGISDGAEEKNGDTAVAQVRYPYLAEAVSRMGASIQSDFLLNEVIGLVDASEAMALDKRHKKLVMMQVDLTNDTAALIKKATKNMC